MSKNAEGWIRHRGGKCPVGAGAFIDVRYRGGHVDSNINMEQFRWNHDGGNVDIMAYRLHKPAEQVEACSKPELQIKLPENYGEILDRSEDGPLQWRDSITDLDEERKTIDALYQVNTARIETERAELVQKLASEGFALIGRVVEPVEDMSDPKNWREGDCFVQTAEDVHGSKKGELWVMSQDDGTTAKAYVRENGDEWYVANSHLKFHSRPSA